MEARRPDDQPAQSPRWGSLGGFVYAIGGQHLWQEDHPLSQVDQYDPASDTWKKVKSLPKPRSHMAASTFVIDGRIMVIGGATSNFEALSDVDTYNPSKNKCWGRYDVQANGYSLLEEKDRAAKISDIPESAFPKPGEMPPIPGSKDGVKMTKPPGVAGLPENE